MTTYPLASPASFGFAEVQWQPDSNSARGKNPWSKADALQIYDGACWRAVVTLCASDRFEGRQLRAWLTSIEGARGTFLLGDPDNMPMGAAATSPGTPVVDGAGQTGRLLDLAGLPLSTPGWLLAGDYLQRGTGKAARLHLLTADLDSDALGKGTAELWPPVDPAPADGTEIVVTAPQGLFAFASAPPPWRERPGLIYDGIALDAQSVVP